MAWIPAISETPVTAASGRRLHNPLDREESKQVGQPLLGNCWVRNDVVPRAAAQAGIAERPATPPGPAVGAVEAARDLAPRRPDQTSTPC